MSTRRNNEINELHPNNPASPRYWKNILPENVGIDQRVGVNQLTQISKSIDTLDVIFGFGTIYDGNFDIDGQTYPGYIEIYITLYDPIKEIQFKLSGVELPVISDVGDVNFGGIVGSDSGITKVSISDNTVTIRSDDEYSIGGNHFCSIVNNECVNKLLLKIPFIYKGTDICFLPYISSNGSNYYISIIDGGDNTHIDSSGFGYWNDQIGGPLVSQCYLPFLDIIINTELSQNWSDTNPTYNNIYSYYYPVLPKINIFGQFDEDLCLQNGTLLNNGNCTNENIPFGGFRKWNEGDTYAPISLTVLAGDFLDSCLIDIDFSAIEEGALNDVGPVNNMGILMDDYKVSFDPKTNEPSTKKLIPKGKLDKRAKGKAF